MAMDKEPGIITSDDPEITAIETWQKEFRAIKASIKALPEKERSFVNARVEIRHLLDELAELPGSEELSEKIRGGFEELEHNLTQGGDIGEGRVSELVNLAERKYKNDKEEV